jgi:hypothetical protein
MSSESDANITELKVKLINCRRALYVARATLAASDGIAVADGGKLDNSSALAEINNLDAADDADVQPYAMGMD